VGVVTIEFGEEAYGAGPVGDRSVHEIAAIETAAGRRVAYRMCASGRKDVALQDAARYARRLPPTTLYVT
jgi:hypothetical protein